MISVVVGYLLYWALSNYKRFQYWRKQGLNGPNPWLTFLRALTFVFLPNSYLRDVHNIKLYGKVYGVTEMDRNSIVVADADLLKDVLVRNFNHFMDRRRGLQVKYMAKFLTSLCGSEWKHTRSIMSPTFTSGKMRAMLSLMNECLKPMMMRVKKNNGQDMDMKSLFGAFTMDVISKTAFAIDTNSHDDENHPFVVNAKKFFSFPPWKLLISFFLPVSLRKVFNLTVIDKSAINYMAGLGHHMIDERRKLGIKTSNRGYNDFLQLMLEAGRESMNDTEETNGDGSLKNSSVTKTLTDEEIIGNVILILLAGYETTASLLTFASHTLATHSEIQTTLREEISAAKDKNNGVLDYETLMNLTYLDAFINETLRMYPPVTRTDRQCSEDITLDYDGKKIHMKKGDGVILPIYALQHMQEYYPDPETFKPERFLPKNKDQLVPYTFLAFVAGPRNCIGMRFALLEAKLALSNLILEFDFVRSPRTSDPLDFSAAKIMLAPKEVIVRLVPRN
jgi:cytochrome P450 family 3 subfamily A